MYTEEVCFSIDCVSLRGPRKGRMGHAEGDMREFACGDSRGMRLTEREEKFRGTETGGRERELAEGLALESFVYERHERGLERPGKASESCASETKFSEGVHNKESSALASLRALLKARIAESRKQYRI